MDTRTVSVLAVPILVAAAALGCSSDAAAQSGWPQIEAQAAKEGRLVIYTTSHEGINDAEQQAFNKKYPNIGLEFTRMGSGDLTARFSSETSAGARSADFLKLGDNLVLEDRPEWFTKLDPAVLPEIGKVPASFRSDRYVMNMAFPYVFTYNTRRLDAPPATWRELTDAKFAGKGLLADPRQNGSFMAVFVTWREQYGDDFLRELGKSYKMFGNLGAVLQQVAAGQTSFSFFGGAGPSQSLIANGAPLKVSPLSPQLTGANIVAVAARAQHPNAALVYVNWLLSVEGQAASCFDGSYQAVVQAPVPGCPPLPTGAKAADNKAGVLQAKEINKLLGLE